MNVLIGMSGGIDSTYAAYLLKSHGHYVEAAALKMSEHTDIEAAAESAENLNIKLNVIDCTNIFDTYIIQNFINEYSAGRTPNPCVMCNRYVKIQSLYEYAVNNGFDKIATGHYAFIKNNNGRYYAERAADIKKDQSYVLWQLTQRQLEYFITPLAALTKDHIRNEAKNLRFKAAEKAESQEICFIPDKNYAGYIEKIKGVYLSGNFVDKNGKIIGRHKGIIHYTVGQRKGLGISSDNPLYITKIDPAENTIVLDEHGSEYGDYLEAQDLSFQYLPPDTESFIAEVKIRYAAAPVPADVIIKNNIAAVRLKSPVRAITPGQSAVFYSGDKLLCGGIIK